MVFDKFGIATWESLQPRVSIEIKTYKKAHTSKSYIFGFHIITVKNKMHDFYFFEFYSDREDALSELSGTIRCKLCPSDVANRSKLLV